MMTLTRTVVNVILASFLLPFLAFSAEGADHISVTVGPNDDVGVGFDELSPEAHNLWITLTGEGEYDIANSHVVDPSGEHIWAPLLITERKKSHEYVAAGVLANEDHGVRFHGVLVVSGSGGTPPEFDASVNYIDIDVDSDNDSVELCRPPSGTDEEDDAEYVGGSVPSTEGPGMGMSVGEDWAKIEVFAHVKKAGTVGVQIISLSPDAWEFADASFNPVTPSVDESGNLVLFQEWKDTGTHSWVWYLRPKAEYATEDDYVVLAAYLQDEGTTGGGSSEGSRAEDAAGVKVKNWQMGGSQNGVFVVDAADVYEDPDNPAKMRDIVVRSPSGVANPQFRLIYKPQGQDKTKVKVELYEVQAGGQTTPVALQFVPAGNWYESPVFTTDATSKAKFFKIKGGKVTPVSQPDPATGPWVNAKDWASDHHRDEWVDLHLVNGGQTAPNPSFRIRWTALWVTLSLKSQGQSVASDNAAHEYYRQLWRYEAFPTALGMRGNGSSEGVPRVKRPHSGLHHAVELCGDVSPADLPASRFQWDRRVLGWRQYHSRPDQSPFTAMEAVAWAGVGW